MTERYNFADDVIAALNNPKRGFFVSAEAVNGIASNQVQTMRKLYHKMRRQQLAMCWTMTSLISRNGGVDAGDHW